MAMVIWSLLAFVGLMLVPVVVRVLRREKWHRPQPEVRVNLFADELADRGLSDLVDEGGRKFGAAVNLESRRPL